MKIAQLIPNSRSLASLGVATAVQALLALLISQIRTTPVLVSLQGGASWHDASNALAVAALRVAAVVPVHLHGDVTTCDERRGTAFWPRLSRRTRTKLWPTTHLTDRYVHIFAIHLEERKRAAYGTHRAALLDG